MFQAFCEKQSLDYVSGKVGVSWPTCARYMERDGWLERLRKIKEKARKKVDADLAEMRARHITISRLQQKFGSDYFIKNGGACVNATEANNLINSGIKNERELAGQPSETSRQEIIIKYPDDRGNDTEN